MAKGCRLLLGIVGVLVGAVSQPLEASSLGVVLDDIGDRAIVFDTETGSTLASVDLGSGSVGDCVIAEDLGQAWVTDFASNLWVIDLNLSPPALAAGTNPVPISNLGQDAALSADETRLVVCGGGPLVSVVDLATRAEIDTFDLGHDCQSVDVCIDGSVLVGFFSFMNNERSVRRLVLDQAGQLTDSGQSLVPDFPTNVHCAPDGKTALVLQLGWDVSSFTNPGLTGLDLITLDGAPATAQFRPAGETVYIRAEDSIAAYFYDTISGTLGVSPILTIPNTGSFVPLGGIDTLALDPTANRLYGPSGDSVRIYDAPTGAELTPITVPGATLTGICLSRPSVLFADGFESGGTSAWSLALP